MKFEKTLIPVFTGVEKAKQVISSMKIGDNFHISSVRPGINCLVVNGMVCDENGVPFACSQFQERFKWFANRLNVSSFVGIGKVVLNEKVNHRNANDHGIYPMISYNRSWSANSYDNIFIEIHDIFQPGGKHHIKFDVRRQVMEAMSRNQYPAEPCVFTQERFNGDYKSKSDIINFMYENAKIGRKTMFHNKEDIYTQGFQNDLNVFEIDLFEVFEGVIESVRTSELMLQTRNEVCSVIDFIRVRYNNSIYPISMMSSSTEHSAYLHSLIESGKIKFNESKIKFKAIKIGEELKLATKL